MLSKPVGTMSKLKFLKDRKAPIPGPKRHHPRNVIWFNPPFSKSVRILIGKKVLRLLDKHCPKGTELNAIFNRSTVKVSYSCMENVAGIIRKHN